MTGTRPVVATQAREYVLPGSNPLSGRPLCTTMARLSFSPRTRQGGSSCGAHYEVSPLRHPQPFSDRRRRALCVPEQTTTPTTSPVRATESASGRATAGKAPLWRSVHLQHLRDWSRHKCSLRGIQGRIMSPPHGRMDQGGRGGAGGSSAARIVSLSITSYRCYARKFVFSS